jgi:RimJ/RimL family protein N-acetyltransferase
MTQPPLWDGTRWWRCGPGARTMPTGTRLDLRELRLWCHAGNHASRRVAERAGYRRSPRHDGQRLVKAETWPVVGYVLDRPPRAGGEAPA